MTGGRTDLCKINRQMMRPFDQFMEEEFGVPRVVLMPLTRQASVANGGEALLQTTRDRKSPYFNRKDHRTGCSWAPRYRPAGWMLRSSHRVVIQAPAAQFAPSQACAGLPVSTTPARIPDLRPRARRG